MTDVKVKDPDSIIDYTHDWATNYLGSIETISTHAWSILPTGELTIDSGGSAATVFVSGGVAGNTYLLTERITTSAGRTADRSIAIRVQTR